MTDQSPHLLHDVFGIESLYPIQARAIERVMSGGDALVVMPTGGGKSLCYQLPALALEQPGVTLVFSPLVALMEDQVAALRRKGVRAQYINSTLDRETRAQRYEQLAAGQFDLIYATPERMARPEFREALERIEGGVKLLAIDEAHCITKWGHDFRPAYKQVGAYREDLGRPTTIALTATATPEVRADIRATLGLDEVAMPLFATGVDRPNLSFEVIDAWDDAAKVDEIARTVIASPGTAIVYFALIKDLERSRDLLSADQRLLHPSVYHGQLNPKEKRRIYRKFIGARPEDRLTLLATNAFGMGVDKLDIRSVIHAQIPGSVEAYYQEVGRAGRDGEASLCRLLYNQDDLAIQQQFVEWMNPSADLLAQASTALERSEHHDFDVHELRDAIIHKNRGDRRAEYTLITLEKLGVVEPTAIEGRYRFVRPLRDDEIDPVERDAKKKRDLNRLLDMVKLTRSSEIPAFLRDYFGLD